jgi:septin family protein
VLSLGSKSFVVRLEIAELSSYIVSNLVGDTGAVWNARRWSWGKSGPDTNHISIITWLQILVINTNLEMLLKWTEDIVMIGGRWW